jgi:hypothetical protein
MEGDQAAGGMPSGCLMLKSDWQIIIGCGRDRALCCLRKHYEIIIY